MTSLLDPDSADLTLLQDRQVAVLGYDAMAAAHALNLRDSGVDVRVGVDPDGPEAAAPEMDGLMVMAPAEAVAACDIVLVATQDGRGPDLSGAELQQLLDEQTEPGDMVIVTDGTALVGKPGSAPLLSVPDGVDLAMLAAVGDGGRVREEYLDGRGSPALVAVSRDGSGAAWATLTAYAAAMGSLRSGAIVTTVEDEAKAKEYAERRVHRPLQRALEKGFDELVAAGVPEEVAYLALLHDLKSHIDEMYLSDTSSGRDTPAGRDVPGRDAPAGRETSTGREPSPLERAGRRVRAMMSWIR